MNRQFLLVVSVAVLLLFAVIYHIWADWGLITIHANQEPLGRVIASMARQGHVKIQTDMPGDTPVTMTVVKVRLTDALETLSVVTESRWRLLYFVAGDKAVLRSGEESWFGGRRPDGWKLVSFPFGGNMFGMGGDDEAPLDPRQDTWTPKTAAPSPIQNYFLEAAQLTNAGFAFPEAWNPTVNSAPSPGVVNRVVPRLIRAAGGREDELFFVSKAQRGPAGIITGDDSDNLHPDPGLLAERTQAEINRLPPEERDQAQTSFNSWQAFRKSLQGMTDAQRMAAIMQRFQDPQVQQQIANQMDAAESRMNHDQRMQRYQNYVTRKLTAMGKLPQ